MFIWKLWILKFFIIYILFYFKLSHSLSFCGGGVGCVVIYQVTTCTSWFPPDVCHPSLTSKPIYWNYKHSIHIKEKHSKHTKHKVILSLQCIVYVHSYIRTFIFVKLYCNFSMCIWQPWKQANVFNHLSLSVEAQVFCGFCSFPLIVQELWEKAIEINK